MGQRARAEVVPKRTPPPRAVVFAVAVSEGPEPLRSEASQQGDEVLLSPGRPSPRALRRLVEHPGRQEVLVPPSLRVDLFRVSTSAWAKFWYMVSTAVLAAN